MLGAEPGHVLERAADVLQRGRPASPRIADAPVLDVPGGDPMCGEVDAQVAGVDQVVNRLPVATVEHRHDRVRPELSGNAQVGELGGSGP